MGKISLSRKRIRSVIVITLLSLTIAFLSGFLIASFCNFSNSYYEVNFTYDGERDLNGILDADFLKEIRNSDLNRYGSVDVDRMLRKKDFSLNKNESGYTIVTKSRYYDRFFFISKKSVETRAKTFIRTVLTAYIEETATLNFENESDIVVLKNHFSPYAGGGFALIAGAFFAVLFISFSRDKERPDIEDNVRLFHTPFHRDYWKSSLNVFKSAKSLSGLAMIFALLLLSKFFSLPSGFGNLGISLAYIFLAAVGLIYGPVVSLIIGTLSDIVGYFITPQQGMFYFGYTVQAALAAFTYGICFYKTRISFGKVLLSRIIVGMLLNVLLGSYLQCRLFAMSGSLDSASFGATFSSYALLYSLPKNLIYLLPQSLVLYLVFRTIIPVLCRFGYIDENIRLSFLYSNRADETSK